jgi:hypothetical protein
MSSERERLELKQFLDAEKEANEKPIREKAAQLARTQGEYMRVLADNLRRWKDPECYVSEKLRGVELTKELAQKYDEQAFDAFVAHTTSYFPCPRNAQTFIDYFSLNGISICDEEMVSRAYQRLLDAGMLETRRAPEPGPVISAPVEEDFSSIPRLSPYTRYPVAHKEPSVGKMNGRDLQTGEYREFNEKEIDDMSADTFKKVFELTTVQDQERNQGPVLL